MAETQKIRMLCLFDYCCNTGFATVASNIMRELDKTGQFEADIVAINFTGDPYDLSKFPFMTYPAVTVQTLNQDGMDPYGRKKFLRMLARGNYDVIFIIQDTFILQSFMNDNAQTGERGITGVLEGLEHKPKFVFYYPIDVAPNAHWLSDTIPQIDYPVPYTKYASRETMKALPDIKHLQKPIYHGTNTDEFFYIEDREKVTKFKHEWFSGTTEDGKPIMGVADGHFVIMNLNRNQPRKDILRSLMVLKELRELGDTDILLYLHMQFSDAGGNIPNLASQLGLELGKDYIMPSPKAFEANKGVPVEIVNLLYNAVDCVITTTLGEGWGLSITEAYATKTPVICPDNTSMSEMGADNRAKLIPSGDTPESWLNQQDDNDVIRPMVNVNKFVKAILEVKSEKALPDIDKAYDWAHKYSWNNVCKEWVKLLTEAGVSAQQETKKQLAEAARKQQFKKGVSKKQRRKARQH